jgi:4-hydroxy-4-methyl-2-oxoglutarate aldolase
MYNQDIASVCERYKKLYVPAVVDTLDRKGLWNQILSSEIMPLTDETKIVGPAFTMFGQSTRMTDKTRRLAPKALAEVVPYSICVMATSDDRQTGHWGELMTVAAKFKGCTGAVVDGGIRDTDRILREKFPIFYKFRCPGDA